MIALGDEHLLSFARRSGVAHQVLLVLLAVELNEIDVLLVWAPSDIGQVFLLGQPRFEPNRFSCRYLIDTHGDLMALHASHGIFVGHQRGASAIDVDQRIGCYHPLVHTIECQCGAFGRPESAFRDTELALVNRLSANNALFLLVGDNRCVAL